MFIQCEIGGWSLIRYDSVVVLLCSFSLDTLTFLFLGLKEVDTDRFFLARLFVSVLSRHAYLPIGVLVCH